VVGETLAAYPQFLCVIPAQTGIHPYVTEKNMLTKYYIHKLVYYEMQTDIRYAILREKQLKKWKREWKINRVKNKILIGLIWQMNFSVRKRWIPACAGMTHKRVKLNLQPHFCS
jgi:hypothetical protein